VRYANAENWAKYFKETEGVQIHGVTIRHKLREAGKIGINGRDKIGRVLRNAFFSEADVRSACADLLQPLPQADKNGFFEIGDMKYGTIRAWSKTLEISVTGVAGRIKAYNLQGIKGKDSQRNIRDFYPEYAICQICGDLLADIPRADPEGFFEKDSQKYGTIEAWSRVIGISTPAISSRIKSNNLQGIKGKDRSGQVQVFYPESAIRKICADILAKRKNS